MYSFSLVWNQAFYGNPIILKSFGGGSCTLGGPHLFLFLKFLLFVSAIISRVADIYLKIVSSTLAETILMAMGKWKNSEFSFHLNNLLGHKKKGLVDVADGVGEHSLNYLYTMLGNIILGYLE